MFEVAEHGFALREGIVGKDTVQSILRSMSWMRGDERQRGGVRNLLELESIRELAASSCVRGLVGPVLGPEVRVVRGTLFDKTSDANWKVPWHQDVTIAVKQRVEAVGYGPWSTKEGVLHVQPPAAVLEKMLSVRVHLDDCPQENGALRVIAGSHLCGKMKTSEVERWVSTHDEFTCEMKSGGALLMRPLLLHASSAATLPGHRRVVHLDYAAVELAAGMDWAGN